MTRGGKLNLIGEGGRKGKRERIVLERSRTMSKYVGLVEDVKEWVGGIERNGKRSKGNNRRNIP